MKRVLVLTILTIILLSAQFACNSTRNSSSSTQSPSINTSPLLVGNSVPTLTFRTVEGASFDLGEAIKRKPTVLIFYRGGWCPYCNTHLGQIQKIEARLIQLGYQILAISPDRPEKLRQSIEKNKLSYVLLSDSKMTGARAFGISFIVDDDTIKKYRGYGIDLGEASGEKHNMLPIPSAFIIGQDGIIKFAYVNPDYKVRVDPDVLLAVAKSSLK